MNDRVEPTLIIPTLFYSWKGHALDRKIPLLRSSEAISNATLKLLSACGLRGHKTAHTDSGIEQEFFLLDANHVSSRPDLFLTGRTLQGRPPAKGQRLSDSYFGIMTAGALKCISEMEQECWKLGIPMTTRFELFSPCFFLFVCLSTFLIFPACLDIEKCAPISTSWLLFSRRLVLPVITTS